MNRCRVHGEEIKKICQHCHPVKIYRTKSDEEAAFEFFASRVTISDSCWIWEGSTYGHKDVNEYGYIKVLGKRVPAHRFSYNLFIGGISPSLVLHHLCANKLCVNPLHLNAMNPVVHTTNHVREAANNRWASHILSEMSFFSKKQLQIAECAHRGMSVDETAKFVGITVKGVEYHRTRILKRIREGTK